MRKTIDFLLNDWLDVAALVERARYSEHSRETFESVLDTCQRIADREVRAVQSTRRRAGTAPRERGRHPAAMCL